MLSFESIKHVVVRILVYRQYKRPVVYILEIKSEFFFSLSLCVWKENVSFLNKPGQTLVRYESVGCWICVTLSAVVLRSQLYLVEHDTITP